MKIPFMRLVFDAEKGNVPAWNNLGYALVTGKHGGRKDLKQGFHLLNQAADNGSVAAHWNLAVFHTHIDGFVDFNKAYYHYHVVHYKSHLSTSIYDPHEVHLQMIEAGIGPFLALEKKNARLSAWAEAKKLEARERRGSMWTAIRKWWLSVKHSFI